MFQTQDYDEHKYPYLQSRDIVLEDFAEVELFDFLFKTRGETRVHGRSARQDDILVEFGTDIDISRLDAVEE